MKLTKHDLRYKTYFSFEFNFRSYFDEEIYQKTDNKKLLTFFLIPSRNKIVIFDEPASLFKCFFLLNKYDIRNDQFHFSTDMMVFEYVFIVRWLHVLISNSTDNTKIVISWANCPRSEWKIFAHLTPPNEFFFIEYAKLMYLNNNLCPLTDKKNANSYTTKLDFSRYTFSNAHLLLLLLLFCCVPLDHMICHANWFDLPFPLQTKCAWCEGISDRVINYLKQAMMVNNMVLNWNKFVRRKHSLSAERR